MVVDMILFNEFIDSKRSNAAKSVSSTSLISFFNYLNNLDSLDYESYSSFYLSSERNYFKDVFGYVNYLVSLGKSPNTIMLYVNYVKQWLAWNSITFTPLEESRIKSVTPRAVSVRDEDIFDIEKIKSILFHSDVFLKALILVLVSSGMRISEALSFTPEQLRGNEIHMTAKQMKAGKPHIYFISAEADQALSEWFKVRCDFLSQAGVKISKCLGSKVVNSDAVFFYSYNACRVKLRNALERAGLYEVDSTVGWCRLTFHGFRKFTDSSMKAHISSNLANSLIGHFEPGDSSYMRYTLEQRREAYSIVEPYLTVLAPADYAESKNEVKAALSAHDKILVSLYEEKVEVNKRLNQLERLLNLRE